MPGHFLIGQRMPLDPIQRNPVTVEQMAVGGGNADPHLLSRIDRAVAVRPDDDALIALHPDMAISLSPQPFDDEDPPSITASPWSSATRCSGRTPSVTFAPGAMPAVLAGTLSVPPPGTFTVAVSRSISAATVSRKFICGRADEARDEQVARVVVEFQRRADLLDMAGIAARRSGRPASSPRPGRGSRRSWSAAGLAVQLGDLDAGLHAQRRVEVGQRLVEQEHLRIAHDGPADGDALALAARELPWACGRAGASICRMRAASRTLRVDLVLRGLRQLQPERHVVVDASYADRAHRTGTPWRCRAPSAAGR